jgi:hypothetical protein
LKKDCIAITMQKQPMAAIGGLLDYLVERSALDVNHALSAWAPRHSLTGGMTSVLDTEKAGEFLRSIKGDTLSGLRDRAGRGDGLHLREDFGCLGPWRGPGITAYLSHGGTLEKARQMAGHSSSSTARLYDRREDLVTSS